MPVVVKKDGQREPFDRDKILRSLRHRLQQAPGLDRPARGAGRGSRARAPESGDKEVASRVIGERVMARLKKLDEVAYVRFASVYRSFRDIDEFMAEMGKAGPRPQRPMRER